MLAIWSIWNSRVTLLTNTDCCQVLQSSVAETSCSNDCSLICALETYSTLLEEWQLLLISILGLRNFKWRVTWPYFTIAATTNTSCSARCCPAAEGHMMSAMSMVAMPIANSDDLDRRSTSTQKDGAYMLSIPITLHRAERSDRRSTAQGCSLKDTFGVNGNAHRLCQAIYCSTCAILCAYSHFFGSDTLNTDSEGGQDVCMRLFNSLADLFLSQGPCRQPR